MRQGSSAVASCRHAAKGERHAERRGNDEAVALAEMNHLWPNCEILSGGGSSFVEQNEEVQFGF